MNCHKLLVWLVILFLAKISVSCGQDMSTSFGFPKMGDSIYTQHIHMEGKPFRSVSHTTGFSVEDKTINAVKFKDIWKTGAKIELMGSPPFTEVKVKFTSMISKGYYFIMEVHYTDRTDEPVFIPIIILGIIILGMCIISRHDYVYYYRY